MKKLLFIPLFICLVGCASTKIVTVRDPIVVPPAPNPVVVETPKFKKEDFPNNIWIKPPVVIPNKRQAAWSFEDIEKISKSQVDNWEWGKAVEEIVGNYNSHTLVVKPEVPKDSKSHWYQLWK